MAARKRIQGRCLRCRDKDRLYVLETGAYCYDCMRVIEALEAKLKKKKS